MLVNLYKSKSPLSVFTLPLIIGLVCLTVFFEASEPNHYFFLWQTNFFGIIQEISWLNYILVSGLIGLNAHQLNNVFNRNSFYSKDTFLPGFIYVTGIIAFEQLDFSPLIVAHLFLIGAMSELLQLKRQEPAKDIVFKGSFLLGMTFVFSPLTVSLAFFPWIALILIKPFIWREWLVAFFGMLLPIFYHYIISYLVSGNIEILRMPMTIGEPDLTWTIIESFTYLITGLCFLVGIFKFIIIIRSQIVNFKKLSQVVLWMLILLSLSFGIGWYFFGQFYLAFLLPMSFIVSIQLLNANRTEIANGLVLVWFIISVVNLFV